IGAGHVATLARLGHGGAKRSTTGRATRRAADCGRNGDRDGEPPGRGSDISDAGLEALAFDSGPPLVCDESGATYERTSDEHVRLAVAAATDRLGRGNKIRLIPGHCDPTV